MAPEPTDGTAPPAADRDPSHPHSGRDRRRAADYWTVPEIARDLGLDRRTIWRKFLEPEGGKRLLAYYDYGGQIRVSATDYAAFKRDCYRAAPDGPEATPGGTPDI